MAIAIDRIETARRAGQAVSADVYPYIAAGTGLDASMPPWLFDGGMEAGIARLDDPATRRRAIADMRSEERRVWKECVSTCRSRWSPSHYTKNNVPIKHEHLHLKPK